jgi:serine/threonine protein kinase
MPASVAEFAKAAEDSGILTAESLVEYLQGVASDTDAAALANCLVKDGRLTPFQAKHIYGGKAKSLVLGPYVVLDMLGKGGMGYVYKAEHRKMRRVVALKVIAKTALKSPAAVRRFEREVQAAARLEHPNIVTAHDAGEAAGTHYLVMQFVGGRNLSEVVKELGPQPVGRAVDWILQAARGLAYAHSKGVVHRDIKPGNLLVAQDGVVKILDMGLARLETLDADQDQLTGTGQIMGTVDYMAPEQAMDTRQADARSDIYSLGVTLWYLIAGRPLFEADSVVKKIMAHQQTPAPSLADAPAAVDPRLETAFQRMVAKQPAERFQSMQEVIKALEVLPRSEAASGPPSIDLRGGPTSLGPLATEATQTLQQPKVFTENEGTARLSRINAETDLGLKKASRKTPPSQASVKPLHLAIGGGTVGAVLLVGLVMFAFGGRQDVKPPVPGGPSDGGSTAQSTPRLDAGASVAVTEPRASPKPAPSTVPQSTTPQPISQSSTTPALAIVPFDATQALEHQEAWANHLGIEVEATNSIGQALVLVPPGEFTMGEGPSAVDVTLTKPFMLGQTEVTQGQWREVMGTDPCKGKLYVIVHDDAAVTYVTWHDAVAFCEKLTARELANGAIETTQKYRLPTTEEWEFACRAGTTSTFSFGDEQAVLGAYAWFGNGWDGAAELPIPGGNTASEQYAHVVRLKQPNAWRLFDMHGNVLEWVDSLHASQGEKVPAKSPSPRHEHEACRGGSWLHSAFQCRSAFYKEHKAGGVSGDLGFRIALTLRMAGDNSSSESWPAREPTAPAFASAQRHSNQDATGQEGAVGQETISLDRR